MAWGIAVPFDMIESLVSTDYAAYAARSPLVPSLSVSTYDNVPLLFENPA